MSGSAQALSVKAVVLVGGEGTRLRPLTETIPKPLVPLVDRPFLHHVLEHLARHGVEEAILSSPYLRGAFDAFIRERSGRPSISWVTEEVALGTGGAVANAARGQDRTILVLNGDILTDLDLGALLGRHRDTRSGATIAVAEVGDARPYGLVDVDRDGRVVAFREKPAEPVGGLVNAGTYVLEPAVIDGIPGGRAVSIEREVFPDAIAAGLPISAFVSRDYWRDVGTPKSYLAATFDALDGRIHGLTYSAPFVDPTASVSLRSHLGRWVVIGPGASVEDDAEVEDSVLLAEATVGRGARVRGSILGPRCRVQEGAVVEDAVLGEGARVP
jgi:mannose-1-phosphate guanylyltransferase